MQTHNFLLVGDVHATPNELEDCNRLIEYIEAILQEEKFDYLVFLGDQAHNHAVLNVHVLNFWKETFLRLRPFVKDIICLVGNHDLPGITGATNINSMSTLDHMAIIVDDHMYIEDLLFVGYKAQNDDFVKLCHDFGDVKYVICHQTFDGATYENGFPATDGIKLEELPSNQTYISGHIHTPHKFGSVEYIGAPRWRTLSDANVSRYVVKFNYELGIFKCYSTASVCREIVSKDILHDVNEYMFEEVSLFDPMRLTYVNLIGPSAWIEEKASRLLGCNIRKCPTDAKTIQVRESEGIDKSLMRFIDSVETQTPKDILKKLVEERIWTKT